MTPTTVSFTYGDQQVTLETGRLAKQATGAVLITMGQTVIITTVVCNKETGVPRDFFPLTVDYQERTYAAGKIPGGFFKREGRPSEKETLTSRLIDRPIRPLFPEGFTREVQIICTVLSLDPAVDPDIPALISASAALSISGLPFMGPIGAARVGYKDGQYLLNPSFGALADSELDLVVAGTETSVLMVESEASELSEEIMLGAVVFGHEQSRLAVNAIKELQSKVQVSPLKWAAPVAPTVLIDAVQAQFGADYAAAYAIVDKMARRDRLAHLRADMVSRFAAGAAPEWSAQQVAEVASNLEYDTVRNAALAGQPRIDGRGKADIRAIFGEAGLLPRAHGSALFTRGETQALVAVRWAQSGTRRLSMLSKAAVESLSCCITTSLPLA
jgi:polyribonucleotide nucleotidyltransferase